MAAGNSRPGPPHLEASCGTGVESSIARAKLGTGSKGSIAGDKQSGSEGFDPTSSFINYDSGNLTSSPTGIISGTGFSGSERVTIPDSFTNLEESSPCLRVGIWRTRHC